jgi:hypothetical protein
MSSTDVSKQLVVIVQVLLLAGVGGFMLGASVAGLKTADQRIDNHQAIIKGLLSKIQEGQDFMSAPPPAAQPDPNTL